MIDVTIKTLDSKNHVYSVPDEITVKQFKDRIASSVSIPADKQRLIYCGRVLSDGKKLSEYGVHEKVIHLVMRAPPQASTGRNASHGQSTTSNSGEHHQRRSAVLARASTGGPSSSAVRLRQAKTMLDRASEVLDQLEELFPSASVNDRPPATRRNESEAESEPMEESPPEPGPSTSSSADGASASASKTTEKKDITPTTLTSPATIPNEDLQNLFTEMDGLNNSYSYNHMEPQMMGGTANLGIVSTSLAGGLAQAASAAFASAISSMNGSDSEQMTGSVPSAILEVRPVNGIPGTGVPASRQASTGTSTSRQPSTGTSTSRQASTGTPTRQPSTGTPTKQPSAGTPTRQPSTGTATSRKPSTGATTSAQRTSTFTTTSRSSSSQPQGNVRGITVHITGHGQRTPSIRLEHPQCNVMVQVFDRYRDVNRRLQPFLHHFYTVMASDPTYENENDPQLRSDQYVIWRVSAAMHFLSHAMHAVSDIIIDLRRTPPRQLRARPVIIPQPAIVQAQINVTATADINPPTENNSNATAPTTPSRDNSSTAAQRQTPTTTATSSSTSNVPAANSIPSNIVELLELDNGRVFMHMGPGSSGPGFGIQQIPINGAVTIDGAVTNEDGNSPPAYLQNLLSSLTSQLEMGLGSPQPSTTSPQSSSSPSSPATTAGVRNTAPVHNSQAGRNSGTNTTNATHIRVTPRPQVLVAPIHVPGMGIAQFDPFLPCSSHHIRQTGRRRHHATIQTPQRNNRSTSNNQQSTGTGGTSVPESAPSTSTSSDSNEHLPTDESRALADRYTALIGRIRDLNELITAGQNLTEEQQQHENMFSQIIQGVVADIGTTFGIPRDSGPQEATVSLHDFLEPIVGASNLTLSDSDHDNFFGRLFEVVSRCLSMQDLIRLFCGNSQRLNQLREPLREFMNSHVLSGLEATEENINNAVDTVLDLINPIIIAATTDADTKEDIDFTATLQNFARRRLQMLFKYVLESEEVNSFGSNLFQMLNRTYAEFLALCVHVLTHGVSGLEQIVERRLIPIIIGMTPHIQNLSVSIIFGHMRSTLSQTSIPEEDLRQYIVSSDAAVATEEESREERPEQISASETSSRLQDEDSSSNDNYVEAMDVDDIGCVEEVATSEDVPLVEPPLTVTVGARPWHSAVPQDWIPVITRDVERQRNVRTDNSLSDGYLCGMPLKRRKIATQNKPHGTVQQVMQDNLRQSLRSSGVNRSLIESVSGELTNELSESFVSHVTSTLRDELQGNRDFAPEKFPKSEQNIRKK